MRTVITIDDEHCIIKTDIDTAKKLLMKNGRCSSQVNDENVELIYQTNQLNSLTSLINQNK